MDNSQKVVLLRNRLRWTHVRKSSLHKNPLHQHYHHHLTQTIFSRAMNSLIRNATLSVSRRLQSYETLEQSDQNRVLRLGEGGGGGGHGGRTWSRRKKDQSTTSQMMPSFSYRRDRAQKRLIFLRSYQLSAVESPTTASTRSGCWGLKKVLLKTKAAVMRPIKSARLDPLRWCGSGGGGKVPAMCATSIRAVA